MQARWQAQPCKIEMNIIQAQQGIKLIYSIDTLAGNCNQNAHHRFVLNYFVSRFDAIKWMWTTLHGRADIKWWT